MNPPIIILVLSLLAIGSLYQLVWTRRVVRQLSEWLMTNTALPDVVPFVNFSRVAMAVWSVMILVLMISFEAFPQNQPESVIATFIAAAWCLIQIVISRVSDTSCQTAQRLAAAREFTAKGLVTPAAWMPSGSESVETLQEQLRRRLGSLKRSSSVWLGVLLIALGVVFFVTLIQLVEQKGSSFGPLLAFIVGLGAPATIVLSSTRWLAGTRARRAQLLWFLAMTVRKQRPLAAELTAWAQSHPSSDRELLLAVARDLSDGSTLADALAARPRLQPPSVVLSIRVAEQTGMLSEVLRDEAVRQTKALRGDSFGSAAGTCLYLWTMLAVGVQIVTFLMYYIVPKFKYIFMGFGTELPHVTVSLITLSDIAVGYWYLFAPPLFLVPLWTCGEAFSRGWSETRLSWLLGFGRRAEIPRLLRRLHDAVTTKLPWQTALRPMVLHHHRADIRSRLERVLGRVTAGMELWPALREVGLLNVRDVVLLQMSERAGNLPWALIALADAKERRNVHRWRLFEAVCVPVFVFIAGLFVAFICVAFFMPIVKLLNDLS